MSFGQIGDCVVLGLPGNPVAVFVCFLLYVWPLLRRMGGAEWPEPRRYRLPALFAFPGRKVGRREFWRGILKETPRGLAVDKFARDGSGLISGLRAADGLIDIPEDVARRAAGRPRRIHSVSASSASSGGDVTTRPNSLPPGRLITHVSLIGFATALSTRAVDPIIPPIAHSLQVDPGTVALLSTAFTLPFALVQPILGPVADIIGKVRMMMLCLVVIIAASAVCAIATELRGAAHRAHRLRHGHGWHIPGGLAIIADAVPVGERQVGIARWLAIVIAATCWDRRLPARWATCSAGVRCSSVVGLCGVAAFVNAVVNLRQLCRGAGRPAGPAVDPVAISGDPRQPARQVLLPRGVPGGRGGVRPVPVRGAAAAGRRRAAGLHRRAGDRGVLDRRRGLFAGRDANDAAVAAARADDRRRHRGAVAFASSPSTRRGRCSSWPSS